LRVSGGLRKRSHVLAIEANDQEQIGYLVKHQRNIKRLRRWRKNKLCSFSPNPSHVGPSSVAAENDACDITATTRAGGGKEKLDGSKQSRRRRKGSSQKRTARQERPV
jgi:hypothetical protein